MLLLKSRKKSGFFETHLADNPSWAKGYRAFNRLLKKPLGWFYHNRESGDTLTRLDRKNHCDWYDRSEAHEKTCEHYLSEMAKNQKSGKPPEWKQFSCHAGRSCAIFPVKIFEETPAAFIACDLKNASEENRAPAGTAFHEFLKSEVSLAVKEYELKNFRETVYPRTLALSTIHSVHRVINTAFSLEDLLPRIGRLCMQILKAAHCSISMVDAERRYVVCKFSTGHSLKHKPLKRKMGCGIEGKVALGGEICLQRRLLAMPLIAQDVFGVIVLRDKADGKPFTQTDLEILQVLSDQTTVAIKNAQLYDETKELTLGSIQSIEELLELHYSGDRAHFPLFAELVKKIGLDLGLSRYELIDLERAVRLLDTGYLGLPKKILSKKTALTLREYKFLQKHPLRGMRILRSIRSLKSVLPIILHHHERYDGQGYPHGLKGEGIPMGARIVAVVDAFTAMISKRPYRDSRKMPEAVEEIKRCSGTQFDPKVVESFLKFVKEV